MHTYIYISFFFSPLCSQVWRKACIAKDCEDDTAGKMSMQWESIEQKYEGLEQKNSSSKKMFEKGKFRTEYNFS